MNKKVERNMVVLLFLLVLVLFSLADRDSKKIEQLYTSIASSVQKLAGAAGNN
jgi:cell shape-determining protein MreC